LDELLIQLEEALKQHRYLSQHPSGLPNLADIVVFGTLRAIDGLPVHTQLVLDRGGPIRDWYLDLKEQTRRT
jgi:hypothetical protein